MTSKPLAVFVPWLHFHQPPIWVEETLTGNLEKMLNGPENSEERWNAQWFAQAYKNPARYIEILRKEGHFPRIMVDYSGVLLEELAKLSTGLFNHIYVDGEAIGNVIELWRYILNQYPDSVEFAGTAYSHCYFPATPERDHEAQIMQWRKVFADLFGEKALKKVRGFWPPEMGMTGDPAEALRFIRLLKKCGYEWLILPRSAIEHPENWSVPALENRVHWLTVESQGETEQILCVIRDTDMGIRQQSGQNVDGCINDMRYRGKELQAEKIPPLIVPTSDGENGNVMMFEYFRNSFAPLFRNAGSWQDIAFMNVSEYIDQYLPNGATTEVRLKPSGGSWIGGHQSWNEGDRRQQVLAAIEQLSQNYANKAEKDKMPVLLCETSCYVYWNSEFWFQQADRCIDWAKNMTK